MHLWLFTAPIPDSVFIHRNVRVGIKPKWCEESISVSISAIRKVPMPQMEHIAFDIGNLSLYGLIEGICPGKVVCPRMRVQLQRVSTIHKAATGCRNQCLVTSA